MNPRLNTYGLLLLAFLTGSFTNLGLISSASLFLSNHDPAYILCFAALSSLAFSVFLRFVPLRETKFALFAVCVTLGNMVVIAVLATGEFSLVTVSAVWMFASLIVRVLYKWVLSDLTMRHLNSADARAWFSYISSAYEFGTLCVMLLLISNRKVPVDAILYMLLALYAVYIGILVWVFVPKRNIEIKLRPKTTVDSVYDTVAFRHIARWFVVSALLFGLFEASSDYMVKAVLKQELGSYTEIREILSRIYLFSSAMLVFASFGVGKIIQRKRLSPILLYTFFCQANIMTAALCLYDGSVAMFTLFGVVFIVTLKTLYTPATQILFSFFPVPQRKKFNSRMNLWYGFVPNAAIFFFFHAFGPEVAPYNKHLLPLVVIVLGLILILLAWRFREALMVFFRSVLDRPNKITSILAVEALSYLHPKDYEVVIEKVLANNPKKLLRKTVIMGLGMIHTPAALSRLEQQFDSDKTEIQLAVIDALRYDTDVMAIKFILEVLMNRRQSTSWLVRFNATKLIAAIYGAKAIPVLLLGLEENNPRLNANVIEVLGWFKTPSLIPIFMRYVDSDNNRLRANALIGLMQFSRYRRLWREALHAMLFQEDAAACASALYALGVRPDRYFLRDILTIQSSAAYANESVKRCLAWCLCHYRHPLGYELFVRLLMGLCRGETNPEAIHFFAQLSSQDRFRILERMIFQNHMPRDMFVQFSTILKASPYDFHEEIDFVFLQIVMES